VKLLLPPIGTDGVKPPTFTPIEKVLKFFIGFIEAIDIVVSCANARKASEPNINKMNDCFKKIFCMLVYFDFT
jgi:hypothetical protein